MTMPVLAVNNDASIPNHETAATAWQEIKAAQTFIKKAMSEINAAEKFIAIGVRLNELRISLKRINQWDKSAPGFKQAFADGRFGMNAKTGSKFALIGEVFGNAGSAAEPAKLPTSWVSLYYLASGFKKHPEKLRLAMREGKINPLLTNSEANELVGKKKSNTKKKEAKPPKVTPMKNFEAKRSEYIKAAKILSAEECEQEVITLAKALHVKLHDLAKYFEKQFPKVKPAKLVWKKHKTIVHAFVARDYEISRGSDLVSHKKTWTLLQGTDPDEGKRRCIAQSMASKEEVIRLAEADYKKRVAKGEI
jgi:hypothetical protein